MIGLALLCAGGAFAPIAWYLGLMTLLSGRMRAMAPPPRPTLLAVLVPAHNEELQIAATVESLLATDYPAPARQVVVVADNCTDQTAKVAEAAGARVLVRTNAELRGKGYALEHAFKILLEEGRVQGIAVVDADSVVSKNLFWAFSARLERGELAVQAEYGVRNPDASWRTRLMAVALAMFHRLRSLARERVGVSAGLRGNGMCFSRALLTQFEHRAYGLTEDVEYGITIGLGGVRVAYADEAKVLGEMVTQGEASESQRERWEGGRRALLTEKLPLLLRQFVSKPQLLTLDLALDIITPPLSSVALVTALGSLAAFATWLGQLPHASGALFLWGSHLACLLGYVGRGMALSDLGIKAVWAMLYAPFYVAWKLILKLKPGRKKGAWIRTRREGESSSP